MTTYSYDDLVHIALRAGATRSEARTMAAIALAESSGNSRSLNDNPHTGDLSYGLWQINMIGDMGPSRRRWFGISSNSALFDPLVNARAAVRLLRARGNFEDWSTYNSGAYEKYLDGQHSPASSGGGGGGAVAYGAGGVEPNASDAQVRDYVRAHYGYLGAYLDDNELGPILMRAARQGWDAETLQGAVYGTHWWKTHSQSMAQFDAEARLDPATHRQRINQQESALRAQAEQMGIRVGDARLHEIAVQSLRLNWDAGMMQRVLGAEFDYHSNATYKGAAGVDIGSIRQAADAYLVPVGDSTLQWWTRQMLEGKQTPDTFGAYLAQQATSLFPQFRNQLQAGQTMQQIADPYRQLAAQTLELDPALVDFTKPKWRRAIDLVDPKSNERTYMSLSDWQTHLMTDPTYGFDHTQNALQQASQMVAGLEQTMGASGG